VGDPRYCPARSPPLRPGAQLSRHSGGTLTLALVHRVWTLLACAASCVLPVAGSCVFPASAPAAPGTLSSALRSSALALAGSVGTAAGTASAGQSTSPEAPIPVPASNIPPAGRTLSANRVLAIAGTLPKMRAVRAKYPGSYGGAYLKGPSRWQVSYFSRDGKEIGQVIINNSGRVLEQWTGFQVAWTMARGYPGAFGRHVNALYIWLPLCVLFILPFFDFRRPFRLLHLDLLMLLSFSISLAFFNHGRIYASVPLAYPPLLYLLARMLALARPGRRNRPAPAAEASSPAPVPAHRARPGALRLLVPAPWLAVGVLFLIGFRIGLNVTDSNVIDVGYAGVIGAQRIVDGKALYGSYPADNEHGDTYGPVNYEAYVPFEQIFGWSGTWDDLPAAHAAAIVFDLLATGLFFLLGRRMRGPTLGIALAYAWVSYPFTLFALESNSNDTLVAVFVLAALLFATSAPARGMFAALAGLTKFAPLAIAPLLATHGLYSGPEAAGPRDGTGDRTGAGARSPARALAAFCAAFILTVAVASIPALSHDSLHTIYERTIVYQANRGSPFSVWGLYGGLRGVESAVEIAAVALALALAVVPRRPDLVGLAAACAAVIIAVQLGIEHWFYLYIPWFFPLALLAMLGRLQIAGRGGQPRVSEVVASGLAQSSRPAVAVSSGSALP
jgi:hypothetical protein